MARAAVHNESDTRTIKLLETAARSLLGKKLVLLEGVCKERAEAALDEAAAIVADAAATCRADVGG